MRARALAGLLGSAVVAAGTVASPGAARADARMAGTVVIEIGHAGRGGYDIDRRGHGPAFRYGFDRGWREGSEEGYRDGRRRRDPRYWREDEFRDGDRGYRGWMGPRRDYVAGFRDGYRAGYRRAFAAARPRWSERSRDGWPP
jgi:hypothetical protein